MADIRVERKSGGHMWMWILLAVVLLAVAALLLDRAGYIDLPVNTGGADAALNMPEHRGLSYAIHHQEA